MNRNIDEAGEESFLNLFREQAFAAYLDQGSRLKMVSWGSNNFYAGRHAALVQMPGDKLGLPQSKLRTSGADRQQMRPKRARCHSS
jgi:hypothetical protein